MNWQGWVWLWVAALCGCGRIGFDPQGSGDAGDVVPDAPDTDTDALFSCDAIAEAPVARFAFDGDLTDSAGGAAGTPVGGPVFELGLFDEAIRVDGIDDVVQLPPVVAASYTVTFWVRTIDIGPGNPNDAWVVGNGMIDAELCGSPIDGDWGTALIGGGLVAANRAGTSTAIVNDDSWHAVAYSRELSTDEQTLYVNGELEAQALGVRPGEVHSQIPWIGVGNNPCDFSFNRGFFAGMIDEVRFYDRRLADNEVAALTSCTP